MELTANEAIAKASQIIGELTLENRLLREENERLRGEMSTMKKEADDRKAKEA